DITEQEVQDALSKASNWKSPGVDGIYKFWWKSFTELHKDLAKVFTISMKESMPEWFTEGLTFLLPKSSKTRGPKNYRPITRLPTMHKVLTSIITERIYQQLITNNILPLEQKGCRKGSYGCKDQLLINKMIMEDYKRRHKNLSMALIDYRKTFDIVPHSWILKTMEMYKLHPIVQTFMKESMQQWKNNLILIHESGSVEVKNGTLLGDSLYLLLFCLTLLPLSAELNSTGYGYNLDKTNRNKCINHLFYMDDLKLYAKSDTQLHGELMVVHQFSQDVGMEFGVDKCVKTTLQHGKFTFTENIELSKDVTIKELDQEGVYKYLEVDESDSIQHAKMKEK
uniref:Reverse transcriptase domain-containing protein n=1 Tax=Latimeria chalumnae TaxID=7897 RepID=H2ZUK8_LATCH